MTLPNKAIAVVGAGMAGSAAAWALAEARSEVVLISTGPGATGQSSGAMDWTPQSEPMLLTSDAVDAPPGELPERLRSFLSELFRVGFGVEQAPGVAADVRSPLVATSAGMIRQAASCDPHLLNLAALPRPVAEVLVADPGRTDFPAKLLARALTSAASGRFRFSPLPLSGLFSREELALPLARFSHLLDAERLGRIVEAATRSLPADSQRAVLLGPWLGRLDVTELRGQRVALGETTSPPEGPAGERLLQALHRLVASRGVTLRHAYVERLVPGEDGIRLEPFGLTVGKVVLATGGLVGGGMEWGSLAGQGWTCPLLPDFAQQVGSLGGTDTTKEGSRFLRPGFGPGLAPESVSERIVAAGDTTEGAPLTLLGAAAGGLRAAESLLSVAMV